MQRAAFALQAGRPDEAELIAGDVLKQSPNDVRAQHVVGYARMLQGRARDAIPLLEKAARRTQDPAIETQLAMALRQDGRIDDALKQLDRVIRRQPSLPLARLEKSSLLMSLGRDDEAVDVLECGLSLSPRSGELAIQLGAIFAARSDNARARDMLSRGLAEMPGHIDGLFSMARLMQSEREFAPAAGIYRQLLQAAPQEAAFRIGLGVCQLELGEEEAGVENLRIAARANERLYYETIAALASAGRGRFFLKPSAAAQFLRQSKS
ncbi:MAG: tetratricopeptide repeat protein [Pseudolabrys sp.]|nr:tetratricopeptide repeat protein [Pseudolabrys sp.]